MFKSLFIKEPEANKPAAVPLDFSSLTWNKAVPKTEPDIVPKLNTPLPLVWRTWIDLTIKNFIIFLWFGLY